MGTERARVLNGTGELGCEGTGVSKETEWGACGIEGDALCTWELRGAPTEGGRGH